MKKKLNLHFKYGDITYFTWFVEELNLNLEAKIESKMRIKWIQFSLYMFHEFYTQL